MISLWDMIGLSAGLIVWVCAIVYFLKNPQTRTATDVDISNALGLNLSASKVDPTNGLFKRFKATKQFEHRGNDGEPTYEYSDTGSELVDVYVATADGRKLTGGGSFSKRIDLDGCSVSRAPKKRSLNHLRQNPRVDLNGQNVDQHNEDREGEYVISRHSSSVHL